MNNDSRPGADIGLAVVLIAISLLTIYGTLELPAGSFEPLGSATIPQVVAGAIIVFSVWMLVNALAARRQTRVMHDRVDGREPSERVRPRYDLAISLMVLAVVYVLVMAMGWVRFSLATMIFLILAVGMLTTFARRQLPVVIVLAVALGLGLEYLFTQVFVIDLP